MIYENVADVIVDDQSGKVLRSPSVKIALPRVIRVRNYIAKKLNRALTPNRTNIALRDNHECQYCGVYCKDDEQTLDHIIPRSRGGKNTWQNLVLACKMCNRYKNDRTPAEAGMKLLKKPTVPKLLVNTTKKIRPEWESWKGMGLF